MPVSHASSARPGCLSLRPRRNRRRGCSRSPSTRNNGPTMRPPSAGARGCRPCHNPWAGFGLAFTLPQLDKEHQYGPVAADQLATLQHIGVLNPADKETARFLEERTSSWTRLSNPYDARVDLEE